MPAVSMAIIRDGHLAWQRAFGFKDTGTNEPVDFNTAFAACSDTKPVFTYGVVKLCEKGVLDLDTPLTKYTTRRITADPRIERITTRHVLNHTTGFPNWRQGKDLPIEFDLGSRNQYQARDSAICNPWFDDTNSLLVVAVTSFAYSPNCIGVGGAYRLDQPDDLEFLAAHGITPYCRFFFFFFGIREISDPKIGIRDNINDPGSRIRDQG